MVKYVRQLLLHLLVILFRKLFNFLCRYFNIMVDDNDTAYWTDDCGIFDCIFDKE